MTICQYCNKKAKLVNGPSLYPNREDLKHKKFYQCEPCDAYVGCHPNTSNPLGILANKELRKYKMVTHKYFDPLWRNGHMKRGDAYKWLSEKMGIEQKQCHIGMFSVHQCKMVIAICKREI